MTLSSSFRRAAIIIPICLLAVVSATDAAEPSHTGYPRLMQGPMVGAVEPTEVRIWIRTSGEFPVSIQYDTSPDFTNFRETEPVIVRKADDYTSVITVGGLEAATEYFYRLTVDGIPDRYLKMLKPLRFETAPQAGTDADLRIVFG
ncbi:MAG: PhoD-like phosphatase N-terminal domain-containing protein [Acidobacteria bacterium]|nr:PhoD-like phosphatase N-terminal domain-containing protein [Candidatus Sulfomarinibacter sp. MAG AM1]